MLNVMLMNMCKRIVLYLLSQYVYEYTLLRRYTYTTIHKIMFSSVHLIKFSNFHKQRHNQRYSVRPLSPVIKVENLDIL